MFGTNGNFNTTLWGQVLKSLDKKVKSALEKNTINLCRSEYDYDKKLMKIFAINEFANKTLHKYSKDIEKIVNDVMFCENKIQIDNEIKKEISTRPPKKSKPKTLSEITGTTYKHLRFENFVQDGSNHFAYKACLSTAMKSCTYNPLLIFSSTPGLGKTHLLHAIANYIKENNRGAKVLITNAKGFLEEYIQNIKEKDYSALKSKYLRHNILIVDDIQNLESKIKTQEQLLNIVEEFLKHGKQIVFSSNKHPINLENFVSSLKDIMSGSTISEITELTPLLAKKIINKKFKQEKFKISDELVDFIIDIFDFTSVREIEATVKSLVAYFSLSQEKLDKKSLSHIFYTIRSRNKNNKREDKLINTVSSYYGIKKADLLSKSRNKKLVYARHITMFLLRNELDLKLKEIAVIFSKKSHATVIHAIEKVSKDIIQDEATDLDINNIKRRVLEKENFSKK